MPISVGNQAPEFELLDEKKTLRRLEDYRGNLVVLYFYPKDDTPGCTTEACGFRDGYREYIESDVIILGVSPDSPESHARFKAKFDLPFPLLADVGHKVCDLYGVWGPKKFMGREYEGVLRTTFLIDRKGLIVKVFENVKPAGHNDEILAAIRSL